MIEDRELVKQLNLLYASPAFVFRENGRTGAIELKATNEVPESDGIYWTAGACRLKGGRDVPAIFRIDTNAGGSLQGVYLRIADAWFEHSDPEALAISKAARYALCPARKVEGRRDGAPEAF